MSHRPPDPLDEMKERFRLAAQNEIDASPASQRGRRWFRGFIVAIGVTAAGTGLAAATGLLPFGSSEPNLRVPKRHSPAAPAGPIRVRTSDPAGRAAWGVIQYRTREGAVCSLAGHVRAGQLGKIRDGVFHPYQSRRSGSCGSLARRPFVADVLQPKDRLVFYGRARSEVEHLIVDTRTRKDVLVRPGSNGAFILVIRAEDGPILRVRAVETGGGASRP